MNDYPPGVYVYNITATTDNVGTQAATSFLLILNLGDPCLDFDLQLTSARPWGSEIVLSTKIEEDSIEWTWSEDLAKNDIETAIDCGSY